MRKWGSSARDSLYERREEAGIGREVQRRFQEQGRIARACCGWGSLGEESRRHAIEAKA